MADFELIQQRRISGKGLIRIPSDVRKNRLLILYADVIRRPKNESLNFNYSPARSRYATITFHRNDYVINSSTLDYLRQSYDGINDITGQNLIAIKCMYDGLLQSYVNLGVALGATPVGVTDLIKDYEYLNLSWTEARIVCYADTAIEFKLYRLIHDTCDSDKDKDKRPPPPPPPPPSVPPGTPIADLDPPYEEPDNPDDFTEPYPEDEFPPPDLEPPGEECVVYRVVIRSAQAYGDPTIDREVLVYGEVLGVRSISVGGGQRAVQINCRGFFNPASPAPCGEQVWAQVFTSDSVALSPDSEIVDFEEYAP